MDAHVGHGRLHLLLHPTHRICLQDSRRPRSRIRHDRSYLSVLDILLLGMDSVADAIPGRVFGERLKSQGHGSELLVLEHCVSLRSYLPNESHTDLQNRMVVNTFGVSVAIEKIGWKLYLIYICWQVIELVTVYLFFPEVSNTALLIRICSL